MGFYINPWDHKVGHDWVTEHTHMQGKYKNFGFNISKVWVIPIAKNTRKRDWSGEAIKRR